MEPSVRRVFLTLELGVEIGTEPVAETVSRLCNGLAISSAHVLVPGDVPPATAQRAKPRSATVGDPRDSALDWIDQKRSPLGKRKHLRLCREGAFPTAKKNGKQWLVRRAELDAYIQRERKPEPEAETKRRSEELDRELEAMGFVFK